MITIKKVGIQSAAVEIMDFSTSFQGMPKIFVMITATITPANTDMVVLTPILIITIKTNTIAKNEINANAVDGFFLSSILLQFLS